MKPIITKTETTTCDGMEITLVGEVFEQPVKRSQEYEIYSQIKILNDQGQPFHPGFSFPAMLSEHELESELAFYKRSMKN